MQRIEHLHAQTREAYGSERQWRALRQQGETYGRHRVRRPRRHMRSALNGYNPIYARAAPTSGWW
ncbi:IS3 family transposase [Xanthomonas sacchari]|uniref:IS3 family transposase n=1 Tax=Xanthomonas sacchari TaxID=56458 RepID=UPI0031C32875|nr:hypothetical protein [Xanthomonas campestris pv. cannae]